MKQSKIDSVMESAVNVAIGLFISTIANHVLLGMILGYPMTLHNNIVISVTFTVISLVRSYTLRRAFNGRSVWEAIKDKFNGNPEVPLGRAEAPRPADPGRTASGVPVVRRDPDLTPQLG